MKCSTHEDKNIAYKFFCGKTRREKTLGILKYTWQDNTKIDLRVIRWGGMQLINLVQDRERWRALVNLEMISMKYWKILE
jgi:hypothetical protein